MPRALIGVLGMGIGRGAPYGVVVPICFGSVFLGVATMLWFAETVGDRNAATRTGMRNEVEGDWITYRYLWELVDAAAGSPDRQSD